MQPKRGPSITVTAGPGGPTAAILALLLTFAGPLEVAGSIYSGGADLAPIVALIDEGDYEAAIDRLHVELDYDPDNADILSLLGFRYRKTRRFDDALTFYQGPCASSRNTAAPTSTSAKSISRPTISTRRCASSKSSTTCAPSAARRIRSSKRPTIRTRRRRVIPDIMQA